MYLLIFTNKIIHYKLKDIINFSAFKVEKI